MFKMKKALLPLLLLSTFIIGVRGCEAFTVKISGDHSVAEKKSARLSVTFSPVQADQSGTWQSNNDNVLKVDKNGIMTGAAVGDAFITFTASADITVFDVFSVNVVAGAVSDKENPEKINAAGCNSGQLTPKMGMLLMFSLPILFAKRGREKFQQQT